MSLFLPVLYPDYKPLHLPLQQRKEVALSSVFSSLLFSLPCLAWSLLGLGRQMGVSYWKREKLSFICLFWAGTCGCKCYPTWLRKQHCVLSSPTPRWSGMLCAESLPDEDCHYAVSSPAVANLESQVQQLKQSAGTEALILLYERPEGIACKPFKLKAVGGSIGCLSVSGLHLYFGSAQYFWKLSPTLFLLSINV